MACSQLFDAVPCFLSVQDKNCRIVEANRRFKQEFGESIGGYCYRVCKSREEPCSHCPVAKTFGDGHVHSSEEEMRTMKGETRNYIVYTAPITDAGGMVTEVIKMSTDITEVKELERHLVSLGEMVASVSHNMKDILGGMSGGLYISKSGLNRTNPERIRNGLEMVEKNMHRLSGQVRDILFYTKKRVPERVRLSPKKLLEDVTKSFQESAHAQGIEIKQDIRVRPAHFYADPTPLHLALSNLVANAIDACKEDRQKTDHWVTLHVNSEENEVRFAVSDNGCGMSSEVKSHIFERFFSTKGVEGTGIGLLVVQKIVQEHGGTISFQSEWGKGSTFMLHFPFPLNPLAEEKIF